MNDLFTCIPFKAIETTAKDDDTLWLSYWIIFCLFKVVEGAADFVISFIPFYFLIKVSWLSSYNSIDDYNAMTIILVVFLYSSPS
jgi:hypothetical protein